eukprot:SAG22_NODE_4894_length_1138_cov_1.831569_1_plen_280_part_10
MGGQVRPETQYVVPQPWYVLPSNVCACVVASCTTLSLPNGFPFGEEYVCEDDAEWGNGYVMCSAETENPFLCKPSGWSCAAYAGSFGVGNWCPAAENTGAERGLHVQQWALGANFDFPEQHCCACGKGIPALDSSTWSKSKQASEHYKSQSNPARTQSQGNPCYQHDEADCRAKADMCVWAEEAGGRLGTDTLDTFRCKLQPTAPNYAEGWRLQEAADDPLQLAKCLDGSAPMYFIKRGTGSGAKKWYVHHEGGGWCYGDEGCGLRGKGAGESQRKTPDG